MQGEETFLPEPLTTAPPVVAPPVPATMPAASNGVNKCTGCGSSDIGFDGKWLVCGYCHHRWNTAVIADELRLSEGIENLVGTTVLTGAKDIDTSSLVTVKCEGCGAVVTMNSENTLTVTCHWCRHTLSLNNPVDNGVIPDAILPFYITREDATARMAAYVGARTMYANQDFLRDFADPVIQAVYLPYLVVDGNVTVRLDGRGWAQRGRSGGTDPGSSEEYRTEVHTLMREADVLVDDLAIEARSTRSKLYAAVSTTNIINAIQPFDVEHAVWFDTHYITKGVAFEKRDIEVRAAMAGAADLFATLVRGYVNQTLSPFTGGVRWEHEQTSIKGTRWISVLLPVWLYAFEENTPAGPMMHYIAVNGRTGEAEGSVPIGEAAVAASAKKRGRAVAATIAGVGGLPLLVFAPLLALGAFGREDARIIIAMLLPIVLAVGLVAVAVGHSVSASHTKRLMKAQRNPDARLRPEFDAKYTPTRLEQSSLCLGTFTHTGGPQIRSRNDHEPHVRAADSRVTFGDAPLDPCAGTDPKADFEMQEKRGWHQLEADGGPVTGWAMSAPPPGNPAAEDWHDDTPVLNRMWERHSGGEDSPN